MMRVVRAVLGSMAVGGLFLAAMVDSPAVAEGEENDGKAIFLAQKCNTCHSAPSADIVAKTKSEAMKGPDIAGLDGDAEQLAKYLRKQTQIDGKDVTEWCAAAAVLVPKGSPQYLRHRCRARGCGRCGRRARRASADPPLRRRCRDRGR